MPSYRPSRGKWIARRKRDGREHFLGYFDTQVEAERAEFAFDCVLPPQHPTHHHALERSGNVKG